jgi:hypothetical protein
MQKPPQYRLNFPHALRWLTGAHSIREELLKPVKGERRARTERAATGKE